MQVPSPPRANLAPRSFETSRREFLGVAAALSADALVGPSRRTSLRSEDARRGGDVEEIVRWVISTPRDPVLRRAARELHAGLDPSRLLGAVLVASAREIRTDTPAFNHAALSVSAIEQLTASAPSAARTRDVLWCLDYFKENQERESATDDWRMTPIESARLPAGSKARAALVDALERWDRDAADAALVAWVRAAPLDEVYALVWEYGTRCVANIGHKAIYAVLSRRALPLAGERFAEDVLRSVVSSYFLDGRTRRAAPFERSRELLARGIKIGEPRPSTDLGPARSLLGAIRGASPDDLPAATAELLYGGAATSTLWDAIAIAASEVTVAGQSVGALHASTATNSLHYIARHTPDERLAALALLQAAAFVAEFRTSFDDAQAAVRLDEREAASAPEEVDAAFARAAGAAAARCDDVHEFKLAAAVIEEARVAGAWARPALHAALAVHLPDPAREASPRLQRIADALTVASGR